jgi:hypothetical protein
VDLTSTHADARHDALTHTVRKLACLLLIASALVGDGGTVQFRKQVGSLIITLFSTPVPLRVGKRDLSVMVQNASDQSAILDATVRVHFRKSGAGEIVEIVVPATHARATNKLLYAAEVTLPTAGRWHVDAQVTAKGTDADASGDIEVLPPQPPLTAHWPYFILVPLIVILFALNQWLRSKRRLTRPPARP